MEDLEIIQSKSYTLCFRCSHKDNLSAGDDASVLSLSKSVCSSARLFWLKIWMMQIIKQIKKCISSRFHYEYLMQKYHQCMGECLIYHEKHKISKGLRAYYWSISIHIVCPHNKIRGYKIKYHRLFSVWVGRKDFPIFWNNIAKNHMLIISMVSNITTSKYRST